MFPINRTTQIALAFALVLGSALVGPAASADAPDRDVAEPEAGLDAQQSPDVCIPYYTEGSIGPVDYRYDGCDVTVSIDAAQDHSQNPCLHFRKEVRAGPATYTIDGCGHDGGLDIDRDELPTVSTTAENNCPDIYWRAQIGPVVWEQTSGCDGEIYVDRGWSPSDEIPE